jgi:aminoglycoside phosphotransferase family enzyme/predicted kinase
VDGTGDVVEYAVEMTRLPKGTNMLERLEAGALTAEELERAGLRLAEFHAAHRLDEIEARNGLPSRLARVLNRNMRASQEGVPKPFPASVHDGLHVRLIRRLARVREPIRRRVAEGRMSDGHGDIRLEHVIRHHGRTAIIDCCEFTPLLRHIDPLSDAAFLGMDLVANRRPDLAAAFERSYLEHSGDPDAARLLPLYRSYRAHVRAMVSVQTWLRPEVPEDVKERKLQSARRMLGLAWTYARTGAVPPVIVLRGPAGVGKSWLSARLAPWLGADVLRSDVVRKELLGQHDPTWRPTETEKTYVYGTPMHERTYHELRERARATLRTGRAALLDATYLKQSAREDVHAMAAEEGAPFAILDITCDPDVVRRRLAERLERDDDASDADQAIYDDMLRTAEPIAAHEEAFTVPVESGRPTEEAILPLLAVLETQLDAHNEPLGPERMGKPAQEVA